MKVFPSWFIISKELDLSDDERDICRRVALGCPVHNYQSLQVNMGFQVDSPISGINTTAKILIENEKGNVVACGKVDI